MFEDVCASAMASEGPVSMFRHRHSASSDYECAGGADVEALGLVSPGSARVQQAAIYPWVDAFAEFPHCLCECSDFFDCFLFLFQGDQEGCDLGGCSLSGHYLPHCGLRLLTSQMVIFEQAGNAVSDH